MELESKFRVPTLNLFNMLCSLAQSRGYHFKDPKTKTVTDTYLDTANRDLYHAGFACRIRHNPVNNTWIAALKGLGGAQGAIHSRAEYETPISSDVPPAHWPASQARDLALQLSQSQPLKPVFTLNQTRHTRQLEFKDRTVGELSLDEVTYNVGNHEDLAYELEIELSQDGTLDDLHALHSSLMPLGLIPEPTSKFERGLALIQH
jgi:triphosphatase